MDGKSKKTVKEKKCEKKFLGLIYCLLPIAFALIGIYYKPYNQPLQYEAPKAKEKPTYVIFDSTGPKSEALTLVGEILDRLGLQQIEVQSKGLKLEDIPMDWDLLWTWKHQRGNKLNWTNLKYYQKVNHWPGNYALASKSDLITKSNSKYIPKGFLTAESTREYAKEHPEKKFIIKKKSNRGIKIVDPKEMNFVETNSMDDYFAQEFVSNPLLWNGTKFDFSIYVLITSVDPLRLYYYDKNFILRFCKKLYNISNPDDVQSYAISDQQIPAQHFEGVKKYIDIESYSYKTAFDEFIKSTGKDIDEIWLKIEDLIRSVVLSKENIIINEVG